MEYSVAKCRVMHIFIRNKVVDCFPNGERIRKLEAMGLVNAGAGLPKGYFAGCVRSKEG